MSTTELPVVVLSPPPKPQHDARWHRDAKRARQLSWASLAWMCVEGIVGLTAGVEANSLSLIVWASSSFVEGLASVTVIWRFTGKRLHSPTSERAAQRWVAGSFLLLVPYFLYESVARLIHGSDPHSSALGIAVTASAIVLMPLLGWAKIRLARAILDPIAALVISGIAVRECVELWRGDRDDCCAPVGFGGVEAGACECCD
jgi:hypothetical protein